jgi:hypothetical protein
MHLTAQQVVTLNEAALRSFLALGLPEGLYLDYKEALSGATEKEGKREFIKDVTAFANAAGGQLILGVRDPTTDGPTDELVPGLEGGDAIAQDLERLASSSIDPRIPGLRVVPVPLMSGKTCVVVHVPLGLSRPHMVNHAGHRSFYVRHSESSVQMTTHEIREAVLASSSAEARSRALADRRLQEARTTVDQQPAFFLQAVPLIFPEQAWDILSTPFEDVLRGNARRNKFQPYATLASDAAPRSTIDGLLGRDDRHQPKWETEVHRTGYVSLLYRDIQIQRVGDVDLFVVHSGTCDVFRAVLPLAQRTAHTVCNGRTVPGRMRVPKLGPNLYFDRITASTILGTIQKARNCLARTLTNSRWRLYGHCR